MEQILDNRSSYNKGVQGILLRKKRLNSKLTSEFKVRQDAVLEDPERMCKIPDVNDKLRPEYQTNRSLKMAKEENQTRSAKHQDVQSRNCEILNYTSWERRPKQFDVQRVKDIHNKDRFIAPTSERDQKGQNSIWDRVCPRNESRNRTLIL